jgi:arylsulfatase A-like enzyme
MTCNSIPVMLTTMNRILSLCLFAVLAGTALAADKPNVLFLFADDMRADSIGALGNPVVQTPNLDALVKRGFTLRNAYCFGGNSPAVCTPSRNMLLSGNAFFRWRDFQPPTGAKGSIAPGDGPNFPLSLQAAGYETYHHGKKGNTAPLIQAKFQHNKYLQNDQQERQSGQPGQEIANDAIQFLKGRDASKPFFMYLAFGNPHDPRVAAKEFMDRYDRAKIPLPKNYLPVHPFDNGEMAIRDERLSPWPRTEEEIRKTLHEYYATITALDHHIGRILKALDELKLTGNTIILFSADQGIAVGSHGLLGKQNLYDAGMKSPLFFAGRDIRRGGSDALVHLFDIYPTVCDLVGAEVPKGIDGVSFKPVLQGKSKVARTDLLLAYRDVQRAWRDDRWKLIRYPQVDVTQLFDLKNDPQEIQNLADDPAHAARVTEMIGRLKQAQLRFADDLPLSVATPKSPKWTPPTVAELKKADEAAGKGKKKKK